MFLMLRRCGLPTDAPPRKHQVYLSVETTQEKSVLTTGFRNLTKVLVNVSTRALIGGFNSEKNTGYKSVHPKNIQMFSYLTTHSHFRVIAGVH